MHLTGSQLTAAIGKPEGPTWKKVDIQGVQASFTNLKQGRQVEVSHMIKP